MGERVTLYSADGTALEGELARAERQRAGVVVCHPHPQYGGSMRSIVVGALFTALPAAGVTCLRFNFRGVEGSGGEFDEGRGERADARAAVSALRREVPSELPLVLAGWSFGADIALSVRDDAVTAWLAIAPPLRYAEGADQTGRDARPKLLALAEHDEVRDPAEIEALAGRWTATTIEVVPGASHFFVGRTDRLVDLATSYVERLSTTTQR